MVSLRLLCHRVIWGHRGLDGVTEFLMVSLRIDGVTEVRLVSLR